MDSQNNFKVIGLMSGTSLDGLDIAYCHFKKKGAEWSYAIKEATTLKYSAAWTEKLATAQDRTGQELIALDIEYGNFLGKACDDFRRKHGLRVDFIASHGHTVFHQPDRGFTYQLGNGNAIFASSGIPVVFDFRSLDVLRGGEGAPLVPAGDKFLFHQYDVCLNLGGIANLSMDVARKRIAYDICFANMGLNYLMAGTEAGYDDRGTLSSTGNVNVPMLKALNSVYNLLRRKRPSLGREIFEQRIRPIIETQGIPRKDKLKTLTVSGTKEIALAIRTAKKNPKVLCTGGGVFNAFFISQLLDECGDDATLILPDDDIIKFKEAMVFAFLGVLKVRGEVNCLKSVTGASQDSSGGTTVGFR